MFYTDKLIELVKSNQGIKSDYELAKMLNIRQTVISNWRSKGVNPNGEMTTRLMNLAGLASDEAVKLVSEEVAEVALLKRKIFAMNVKVCEYINPRKINYLRELNLENLTVNNIHYTHIRRLFR